MSTVIYATPVFKKVRYNRKVEEDGGKRDEREEVVYESADGVRDERISFQAHERGPQVQDPPPVQRKSFRAAALCLGVLCLLMMVGLIILSVRRLTVNYKTLSKNHSLLQDEVKMLNNIIEEGKLCPKGWKRFGSSYYFKSTEKKSWYDSRYDCQSRGSDLVSINSKEEQEFVTKFLLSKNEESWIGLRTKQSHQRGPYMYMWEWVDGSSLTETFWARDPYPSQYYHATCCDRQGQWTQTHYNDKKTWICEKQISSFT
ncbi:CD209 antigen-like protein E isoform X2 [Anabas testudineus]|uniref:CD209 antigen-like protein E isoform X2 n=1 Tax=Anabas testudineus TaxID=64144 RepID=UPI000E45A2C6|nr:CD209 antigen-like protein E isoform X2 [Anabas testudineus]